MTDSPVAESVVEPAALAWLERLGFLIKQAPEISLYGTQTAGPVFSELSIP
jgi:hypothetical protein